MSSKYSYDRYIKPPSIIWSQQQQKQTSQQVIVIEDEEEQAHSTEKKNNDQQSVIDVKSQFNQLCQQMRRDSSESKTKQTKIKDYFNANSNVNLMDPKKQQLINKKPSNQMQVQEVKKSQLQSLFQDAKQINETAKPKNDNNQGNQKNQEPQQIVKVQNFQLQQHQNGFTYPQSQQQGTSISQLQQIIQRPPPPQVQVQVEYNPQKSIKDEGRDEYLFRRRKIEEFQQEMLDHPYLHHVLNDQQDRKVLSEYMYEKNYRSLDEYQFVCQEKGKSLLGEPYQYFNLERQFQKKSLKDKIALEDKQRLLFLNEELEPKAKIQRLEKQFNKEEEKRLKLRQEKEQKLQKQLEQQKEYERKEFQRLRNLKRKRGIDRERAKLRRQLQLNDDSLNEVKAEEGIDQSNQVVDQSSLYEMFYFQGLRDYKIRVFELVKEAYEEARQSILNKLQEKRINEAQRKKRQRDSRKPPVATKRVEEQKQVQDIDVGDLSDQSVDSLIVESPIRKLRKTSSEEKNNQTQEAENGEDEVEQMDILELTKPELSESFDTDESIFLEDRLDNFVIIQGEGWLAIPK